MFIFSTMLEILILLLNLLMDAVVCNIGLRCDMIPEGVTSPRKINSGRYKIDVSGNQETYIPGDQYTGRDYNIVMACFHMRC